MRLEVLGLTLALRRCEEEDASCVRHPVSDVEDVQSRRVDDTLRFHLCLAHAGFALGFIATEMAATTDCWRFA